MKTKSPTQIANEKLECRNLVKTLNGLEMTQEQFMFLIYLISLEFEDIEVGHDISIIARSWCEDRGFMIGTTIDGS